MKKFLSSVVLCLALLIIGIFIFLPYAQAAEKNLLQSLLDLPAPPPINPLFESRRMSGSEKSYDKNNLPADDAPIEDLLVFWEAQSGGYDRMGYNVKPSEKALARIIDEIERNPETLPDFLNILPENRETAEFVKRLYDNNFNGDEDGEKYQKNQVKQWLTYHSDYFSEELVRAAQQVADENEYVSNQTDLLALTRVDFEKARPILERLYNDRNQRAAPVLARWAFYQHAIAENSTGDIEKYRDELKAIVEDKTATAGMRDLALDALVMEKEWEARDDWYVSLLADETLHDLRAEGHNFTGLTTILNQSPPEKYAAKMLELINSSNPAVRGAAIRNLAFLLNRGNPEIAKALLPWLENPNWAKEIEGERSRLIEILQQHEMPESVPGLIAVLNEKVKIERAQQSNSARMNANVMIMSRADSAGEVFPYRSAAISALATQKDARAISPLRIVLPELREYERGSAVRALLSCGGFTISEQVEALEAAAENFKKEIENSANEAVSRMSNLNDSNDEDEDVAEGENEPSSGASVVVANSMVMSNHYYRQEQKPFNPSEIKTLLAAQLVELSEPDSDLVFAVAERIEILDRRNSPLADALRKIVQNWNGAAVNTFLLKDLRNKRADADTVVKLLSIRRDLREKQSSEIFDARGGNETARGVAACLLEEGGEYDLILISGTNETKTAMLACARLIRAALPLLKVAENLSSADKTLALAAERYLESEDSPEARQIVLSLHPNEAKILGATTFFEGNFAGAVRASFLSELFTSVNQSLSAEILDYSSVNAEIFRRSEKDLQKEVLENADLLGVYAYDGNHIRIFKDRAIFSWDDGVSRYRERELQKSELESFKRLLLSRRADELAPFLSPCEECRSKQFLMLGRSGGRRIFLKSERTPEFFAELNRAFAEMRTPPAKLRYRLERTLANLEILFADENFPAYTLWKNGKDLRVLIDDRQMREQIEKEIARENAADQEVENPDYENIERIRRERREKKQFDSVSWRNLIDDNLGSVVAQPVNIELPPTRDAFAVKSNPERWKTRAANVEIRVDRDGLYKISGGRIAKIRDGYYQSPIITADGRWAVATKYDNRVALMRVNLATGKEFEVKIGENQRIEVVAFVASINKVLISTGFYGGYHGAAPERSNYYLLDAATGALEKTKGEFRPIVHQTFRTLQPAANDGEFWAAIPNEKTNQTAFGVYDAKKFAFKPLLKIPRISFDSMAMWFDAAEQKIYFVYEGHVLALPVKEF